MMVGDATSRRRLVARALLGLDACLRKIMLQMFDAPKGHHTFPLRRTPTERLWRFGRCIIMRVERGTAS